MAIKHVKRSYGTFIRWLTPTALALLSVELRREFDELTSDERALLSNVDAALEANVGEVEADQLRQWELRQRSIENV